MDNKEEKKKIEEKEKEEKKEDSYANPYSFLHPNYAVAVSMMNILNSNN